MAYRIAGVDVHKKMLAVDVSDVEVEGEYQFERRTFGSNPEQLGRYSPNPSILMKSDTALISLKDGNWAKPRVHRTLRRKREGNANGNNVQDWQDLD